MQNVNEIANQQQLIDHVKDLVRSATVELSGGVDRNDPDDLGAGRRHGDVPGGRVF